MVAASFGNAIRLDPGVEAIDIDDRSRPSILVYRADILTEGAPAAFIECRRTQSDVDTVIRPFG